MEAQYQEGFKRISGVNKDADHKEDRKKKTGRNELMTAPRPHFSDIPQLSFTSGQHHQHHRYKLPPFPRCALCHSYHSESTYSSKHTSMRLILTGATGVVGSAALNHILNLPKGEVSALYILSRSPVPMAENQLNVTVIQHKNFNEYPPDLLEKLKGADGCIWAQGISQSLVSKE